MPAENEHKNKFGAEYQRNWKREKYSNDPEFKKRVLENSRRYGNKNRTKIQAYQRHYKIMQAYRAMEVYGLECQECGCNDLRVLQWHHKNGYQNKNIEHQRERKNHLALHNLVIKAGERIPDIELLCANCHILADLRDETGRRGKHLQELWRIINASS